MAEPYYEQHKPCVISLQTSKSILHITPSFQIQSTCPVPNWWIRFWHKALLGWWWEQM